MTLSELQSQVVGFDTEVPLLNGTKTRYINFDNAASTPTVLPVQKKVDEFCRWYSNVHRGTGFKSMLSSWVFEKSRKLVGDFIKSDSESHVIFCKNTTEAINKVAGHLNYNQDKKPIILTTLVEHHSNELPWRRAGDIVRIGINDKGRVNLDELNEKLDKNKGKVRLVAVNGASNVTGYINPIHAIARKAHDSGAEILVDAAQLIPHRPVDVKPLGHPEHIDYLAFSAHKIYAPYGIGVLVTSSDTFNNEEPEHRGGGTVEFVSLDNIIWSELPEREEAGTPDILGAVALAKILKLIKEIGFDKIVKHEVELTKYALKRLSNFKEITIYGDRNPENATDRLGVIPFNIKGIPHALVSAVLSYEGGIGVRNGCFCAHPYVKALMNVSKSQNKKLEERIQSKDKIHFPGTVRISFGFYNKKEEVDRLCSMIRTIINGDYLGEYKLYKKSGEYHPVNYRYSFSNFFDI